MILFSACRKQEQFSDCRDDEGLYRRSPFPIGAAIDMDALRGGSAYEKIAREQFNSVTPENIFKANAIHPEEHSYNWFSADELAEFCAANGKRLHGHTLIWHEQLPAWISRFDGNAEAWERLMKEHIQTIMQHFKGKAGGWDVVNEAFETDGTLRSSIWREKIGDQYIEKAFRYAQEADPDAALFYNDFLLEMNPAKRRNVLSYLDNLRSRGIKIDGIGLQMHISNHYPETEQIAEALKEISDAGYKIHISELDISVNPFGKDIEPDKDLFEEQAHILGAIVHHYKQIPAEQRYGITFWGISDRDSWIRHFYKRKDYPLLYDDDYLPKPAYCKLKATL